MLHQVLSLFQLRLPSFLTSVYRSHPETHASDTALLGSGNVDTCAIDLPQLVQKCVTEELERAGLRGQHFSVRLSDISRGSVEMQFVAFVKVDRYIPDLLDRSQVIEAQVRSRLNRIYQIQLHQMFWRLGDGAITPFERELCEIRKKKH